MPSTTLIDYPALFNNTPVPFFYGRETYNKVQTTSMSESGKDLIQVVRDSKLDVSCSFKVAGVEWVQFFRNLSLVPSFSFKVYDVIEDGYKEYTVRMENYSHLRVKKSDQLAAVKGVWNVSFTLKEF